MGVQQSRPRGADAWYAPARDLTVCLPALVQHALGQLSSMPGTEECTQEALGEVAVALANFFGEDAVLHTATYEQARAKCGLTAAQEKAVYAVQASLGECVLAAFWHAIRASTTAKQGEELHISQYDPHELAQAAVRAVSERQPA